MRQDHMLPLYQLSSACSASYATACASCSAVLPILHPNHAPLIQQHPDPAAGRVLRRGMGELSPARCTRRVVGLASLYSPSEGVTAVRHMDQPTQDLVSLLERWT